MSPIFLLLDQLLFIYLWLVIAWVILGWLQAFNVLPYNKFVHSLMGALYVLTNPVLDLFRRLIPPISGFDLSPIFVFISIHLLRALLLEISLGL